VEEVVDHNQLQSGHPEEPVVGEPVVECLPQPLMEQLILVVAEVVEVMMELQLTPVVMEVQV
jgi:hypothetical protein